ncbi:hypothetical protein CYMTET_26146 [Cymbomonas tetramitiformis]|uniref:Uncharacterized protein n=1 Tax=Cymbomonas tetramitiformis TaxID=36881 RepID=A0AAE0FSF7_9CHLO|nr:hypothetical protein CYMTET_26146 [Cymbomonas tetramitiformis]
MPSSAHKKQRLESAAPASLLRNVQVLRSGDSTQSDVVTDEVERWKSLDTSLIQKFIDVETQLLNEFALMYKTKYSCNGTLEEETGSLGFQTEEMGDQ